MHPSILSFISNTKPKTLLFWRFTLIAYTAAIVFLCLANISQSPAVKIMFLDKFLHLCAYSAFAILSYFCSQSRKQFNLLLTLFFFVGLGIEFAQGYFTAYRGMELADQLANTLGLSLVCNLVYASALKKRFSKY